ncbi:Ig-like domain-containing protein, partial [Algibacter pacificus]|uniref:Ig-like domain-containing protein n=1 Tax=Algibacter pacificus TaxID=2599389 RepID=UPI0011CC637A
SDSALTTEVGSGANFTTPALTATTTYYVTVTGTATCENAAGTGKEVVVTVNPLPVVAITGDTEICVEGTTQLSPTTGGTWVSNNIAVATVDDSGLVTAMAPGSTTFTFTNTNGCAATTEAVLINPLPTISISNAAACSADLLTYDVSVEVSSGTVTSTSGTVANTSGNTWAITGVTSGTDITLTVEDANTCSETLAINAPDCNCPVVDAPISGGDQATCLLDPAQTLTATATVNAGEVVDWYASSTGGTPVTPELTGVGTATYYAEARNTTTNCVSSTRTAVNLEIYALPTITISSAAACSSDLLTYDVSVEVSSGTVTSTSGTVTNTSGNTWAITGVTSGTDITLTVEDANTCSETLAITAPDCNCPVV